VISANLLVYCHSFLMSQIVVNLHLLILVKEHAVDGNDDDDDEVLT